MRLEQGLGKLHRELEVGGAHLFSAKSRDRLGPREAAHHPLFRVNNRAMGNEHSPTASHPVGDKTARQRFIVRSVWFTVPGTLAAVGAAYVLAPPLRGMQEPIARLALATRWLVVAMLPYVAVCGTIATNRLREGSHDPTLGDESTRLKIHCRVMQNTLEQLVWFAVCVLAIAPMLSPTETAIIPIASVAFVVARLFYWWGYLQAGTLGRAPGVQTTFTLNGALLLLALALLAR